MKKVLVLLFMTATLILSCEYEAVDPSLNPDENGGSGDAASTIEGTWKLVDSGLTTTTTTDVMGQSNTVVTELVFESASSLTTFNVDGTYATTGQITTEVFVNEVFSVRQVADLSSTGTFTLDPNDNITFNSQSGRMSDPRIAQKISLLNARILEIELAADYVTNPPGLPTTSHQIEGYNTYERL